MLLCIRYLWERERESAAFVNLHPESGEKEIDEISVFGETIPLMEIPLSFHVGKCNFVLHTWVAIASTPPMMKQTLLIGKQASVSSALGRLFLGLFLFPPNAGGSSTRNFWAVF